MRVAFVSMLTAFHEDGPGRHRTRRLARGLAARGHDVTVFCARWWDGEADEFEESGVRYRGLTAVEASRRFGWKLIPALKRFDPDLVHAVHSPPAQVAQAARVGRLTRTPVLVDWWYDRPGDSERAYRKVVGRADALIVPSRTVDTRLRERGAPGDLIRIVPPGVDFDLVREADADERADLVYARRLDGDANVETFLLALAELRDRDWTAAVVGDGPARAAAERTAADLRIDDRVEFLGSVPETELVSILKGAHVFAQTAEREAFAANLLRALACGCVGIVEYQADSGAHELVEGRERGRLVTSPDELADEIVAAGDLPRERIDESFAEYDRRAVLECVLDCYRDLIRGEGDERGRR